MLTLRVSQIQIPNAALSVVENAVREISFGAAPSLWLDESLIAELLRMHPVFVRKSLSAYEVVKGFRTFHALQTVCNKDFEIEVNESLKPDDELIFDALFELIASNLMYVEQTTAARRKLYRVLRNVSRTLRDEYAIKLPAYLTPAKLRAILQLNAQQTKLSHKRASELTRLMGGE